MATPPPLPKGAVVVGGTQMPPLPKGATIVDETPPPADEPKEEPGFIERFKETFQPAKSMLEESILPMVAPPGGYTPPADVRTVFGGKGTPPAAQQIVGDYLEQQRQAQAQRLAEQEAQPKQPLPGVVDTLKALGNYAVKDPGGFTGQFASALIADPALLMAPEFIPERVVAAIAKGSKLGAAAVKTADAAAQATAVAAGESAARQLRETGTIDMEKLRNDAKNAAVIAGGIRATGAAIAPGAMLKPGTTEATQKLVKEAADEGYAVPMEHLSAFGAAIDKYFSRPQTERNSKLFVREVTEPTGTPVKELNPDNMAKIDSNLSNEVKNVLAGTSLTIPKSFLPELREFLKYKKGSVKTTLDSIEYGIPIRGEDWHEIRSLLGQQRNAAYGSNPSLASDLGDIMNGWDSIASQQLPRRVRVGFQKWKSKYVAYADLFDAVSANPTSYNNFLRGEIDPQDLANAIRGRRPKEAVQRRTQRQQTAAATRAAALDLTKANKPKSLSSAFPFLDPAFRTVLGVPAKLSQMYMYSAPGQRTMIGGPGGGITMGRVPRLVGEIPALNLPSTEEGVVAPPEESADSGELPAVVPDEMADLERPQPEGMADGGVMLPADRSSNFRAPGEKADDRVSRFGESFISSFPEAGMASLRGSFDLASLIAKYLISPPAQKAQMLAKVPGLAEAVVETAKTEVPKIPARVAAATPEDYGKFAAQYTADTLLDPMRLGQLKRVPMSNVAKPKGGTVVPGGINQYVEAAKTNAGRVVRRDTNSRDVPPELENFWESKARNYFLKNFGSEDDPIRDAIMSGKLVKGDWVNEKFRDYMLKAARQGDPEAFQDFIKRYDESTGIQSNVFLPENQELPQDYIARTELQENLKQREASKIPMINVGGRQVPVNEELINIEPSIIRASDATDPEKYVPKVWRELVTDPQPENIKRAISSGETIYDVPVKTYHLQHFDPGMINTYLATKTPEEIKNMTFPQAVTEATQHFKDQIISGRVITQIKTGKNVDRAFYDANTTPVFNYEDGSKWVKFDNQKAMDFECAHIGHCGMISGGNEQIDTGQAQVFSLRDNRGHPLTTVELQPARERFSFNSIFNRDPEEPREWIVNQMSGEGRKTGNATPNATSTQIINLLDSIPNITQIKYSNAVGHEIPNAVLRWANEKGIQIVGAPTRILGEVDELAKGGMVKKSCGCHDYTEEEQRLLKRYATG